MKCNTCSHGAAFGHKSCVECLKKAKKRSAKRYAEIKTTKRCKSCANTIGNVKGIYCKKCRARRHDKHENLKLQGLCVVCGKHKAGKTLKCEACHVRYIENIKAKREARFAEGKCKWCDTEAISGASMCEFHYLQMTAKTHLGSVKRYKELQELYSSQNGLCPYTHKKLTLGMDASIDHIVPKSRGGSSEIKNLQWVYYQVNFMKQSMLPEEFISLVNLISETYKSIA